MHSTELEAWANLDPELAKKLEPIIKRKKEIEQRFKKLLDEDKN